MAAQVALALVALGGILFMWRERRRRAERDARIEAAPAPVGPEPAMAEATA